MAHPRTFIADIGTAASREVLLSGWARALRTTKSTTFLVLQDASGIVQAVAAPNVMALVKREDAVTLRGRVREDARAPGGFEINVLEIEVVGAAAPQAPIDAQSPQFYKEHGVVGFERVFETGHVYRAEPHASSRHLTEYYSLDLELGFIDGPRDVVELERELLSELFESVRRRFEGKLGLFEAYLPSLEHAPSASCARWPNARPALQRCSCSAFR